MKKIDDIEVAKMLLDPRKRNILDIAKNPVTVSQMAEELQEKQSRLYYHVKKLEEAGLLELVETRQLGNLIEKYYQTSKAAGQHIFQLDESLQVKHHGALMEQIMNVLQPGLKLLEQELKNGRVDKFEEAVHLAISFNKMTGKEWNNSHNRMLRAIKEEVNPSEDVKEVPLPSDLTEEQMNKKSKYAYFLLSYRIDDTAENKEN